MIMEYTTVVYYETTIIRIATSDATKLNRQDDTTTSWDLARIAYFERPPRSNRIYSRLWSMCEPNGTESVPVASS
jgi:hypothetical protein